MRYVDSSLLITRLRVASMMLLLSGCAVESPQTTSAAKDDEAKAAIAGTCKPGTTSGNVNCVEEAANSLTATKSRVCNSRGKGFDLGACEVSGCKSGYYLFENKCLPNACTPGKEMGVVECSAENAFSRIATKSRSCNTSGNDFVYGPCIATGCSAGYLLSNGKCVPEPCRANQNYGSSDCKAEKPFSSEATKSKDCRSDGIGYEYGNCFVKSCTTGYRLESNSCVAMVCEPNRVESPVSCVESIVSSKEAIKTKKCNETGSAFLYGECSVKSCKDGYYLNDNSCLAQACVPNQEFAPESCSIPNSLTAFSTVRCNSDGSNFLKGSCIAKTCADGYELFENHCRAKLGSVMDLPAESLLSEQRKVDASKVHKIWTVNTAGKATLFTIDGDKVTVKSWTGIVGTGGARTFLTEGGFVAARYPYIYFIDPENTPEGALRESDRFNTKSDTRICLASYLKKDKRYLFAAWGTGKYLDVPLADEKPYAPLWDKSVPGAIGVDTMWGYSCYIDQVNNIFYSQFPTSGNVNAINLNTLSSVTVGAPNQQFVSKSFPNLTQSTKLSTSRVGGLSYAMAGDSAGNVFNGDGVYTMAIDEGSDSVWVSLRAVGMLQILPRDCLITQSECTGMSGTLIPPSPIGPMSALKDGRIVGLTRSTGEVYIFSLKDKTNRAAGIDAKLIGNAGGDPYMYTDFTGAGLYLREANQTFDLSTLPGFKSGMSNLSALFSWKSKSGSRMTWKDIKFEARCFDDESKKPAFEEVKSIGSSDLFTNINVMSCYGSKSKFIELHLEQLNGSKSIYDIEYLQIAVKQAN